MAKKREVLTEPASGSILKLISPKMLLMYAPLLLFPLMINLRVFPFVAPNEEPKWGVLIFCGLWMGLTAAWILWRRSEPIIFRPSLPAVLLFLFFLLLGVGVFVGPNMIEGMIRFSFWLMCGAVWLLSVWAMRHQNSWVNALCWSLSVGTALFSLRYWWGYVLDYGKTGYNVSVLFSPIGHVNFTGDVLVVLLPAVVWMLAVRHEPVLKVLNWFSVMTIGAVLLVASSRGALGGLAIGALVLVPFLLKFGKEWLLLFRSKEIRLAPFVWVGTALVASFIVYQSLPYHYRDLARVSGTLQATFETKSLTENAEQPPLVTMWRALNPVLGARTPMYASATAMAFDAPLLGQGTGNFAWVYPGYSNRFPDFRDPLSSARTFTTNPHNIVLQLSTQNGLPATLIFIGLLLFFWYLLARSLWKSWDTWCAAGVVAISAAIFDSMFNHVFFNPASMFVFALLGGCWWGYVREGVSNSSLSISAGWRRSMGIALVVTTLFLSVWPVRWLVSEWNVGQAMAHMRQPSISSDYYDRAYAWDRYNFRAVFGKAQSAYQQKRFGDAIRYLNHFEDIFPYNPPALNMLGASYMMMGKLSEAESAFRRCLVILPDFEMAQQNLARVQAMVYQRPRVIGR